MKYSKSIITFGILIPSIVTILVAAAAYFGFSHFNGIYLSKKKTYQQIETAKTSVQELKDTIAPLENQMLAFDIILSKDVSQDVTLFFNENLSSLTPFVNRTYLEFPISDIDGTQFRSMEYRGVGRYEPFMLMLAKIETFFPQLKTDSIDFRKVQANDLIPSSHLDLNLKMTSAVPVK